MKKLIIVLMLLLALPVFANQDSDKILKSEKGIVTSVEFEDVEHSFTDKSQVKQLVTVKLLTGEFKGQSFNTENMITNNPYYDIILHKGDKVILHSEIESDGTTINYDIADVQRVDFLYVLTGLFFVMLFLVGRKKGVFSLISIIVTVLLILFLMVPMIRNHINPILSALLVSVISTTLTMYLVGGFNNKSLSAIIGVMGSLVVASCLSLLVIKFSRLTGFCCEETMYLYSADSTLDFKGILTASMMLATLGAVMDTGMSIASSINEIFMLNPQMTVKSLFVSGMNVGKDIIGTMANTLILVYLGSSLPLVLLSQNIDLQKFFNLNQVVTEISSAIIGSIAIVLCVPITAFVAANIVRLNKNEIDDIMLTNDDNEDLQND